MAYQQTWLPTEQPEPAAGSSEGQSVPVVPPPPVEVPPLVRPPVVGPAAVVGPFVVFSWASFRVVLPQANAHPRHRHEAHVVS